MSTRCSIFVTRLIPRAGLERLEQSGHIVEMSALDGVLSPEDLCVAVRGRDAVLCQVPDKITADVLDAAAPTCRIFANMAVGYENFDVAAARARAIYLSNTPGVLTDTTADLAWALLMAAARRLGDAERDLRAGRWPGWRCDQYLGQDVHGSTLGIIGFGRIGRAVARRAAGFEMRVLYADPAAIPPDQRAGAEPAELDELLRQSDIVSIHCALTPETRHLIGARELHLMKPTAILINTSRGAVVDESALVEALACGDLFAAGLDVFEHEPRVTPALMNLPNVVLLPHIGSATAATRDRMALMAADNILAVLRGERPPNEVTA